MTLNFHSNLSKDLSLILNNSDDYNVIIQVGKNQDVKEIPAHSVILRARSPYLKAHSRLNGLQKRLCEDILELLIASDELLLEELVEYLQEYLIKQQNNWVQQNSVFVLNKFASYNKLQDFCLESVCENIKPFITSLEDSLILDKDIFYIILERNDLHIKEIDVWII
ncbi:hypothetical protein RclHR1_02090004 [Rhizophagus clarus]|uniref:Uncharacterized protein n=1 Tax=Rhizophagus clarus TaxID=94130 RepID=A0A2Z6QSB5_9GLOM|nr:hypothetical protein RclHR1_02090004 [Rhizophagus clarus]